MELFEQINADIKTAMRAKDKEKLEVLRAIKSELLLIKTSAGGSNGISKDAEIKLLQKMVKQRKDAGAIYKEQGREDLAEKEFLQAELIQPYLPKQLNDSELTDAVQAIIEQTGASSMKDMGKVMGMASKQLAGKAEGKLIAAKVKELLA